MLAVAAYVAPGERTTTAVTGVTVTVAARGTDIKFTTVAGRTVHVMVAADGAYALTAVASPAVSVSVASLGALTIYGKAGGTGSFQNIWTGGHVQCGNFGCIDNSHREIEAWLVSANVMGELHTNDQTGNQRGYDHFSHFTCIWKAQKNIDD